MRHIEWWRRQQRPISVAGVTKISSVFGYLPCLLGYFCLLTGLLVAPVVWGLPTSGGSPLGCPELVSNNTKRCAIVNAFGGTGTAAAQTLIDRGFHCVHVQTEPDATLDRGYLRSFKKNFGPHSFRDRLVYDPQLTEEKNLDLLSDELGEVDFVLGPSESGMRLAQKLSHRKGTPADDPDERLQLAYRDKAVLGEVLRENNIRTPLEKAASTSDEMLIWVHETLFREAKHSWRNRNPRERWGEGKGVFIKPTNSAGGEGVEFCLSDFEVQRAFNGLINQRNHTGEKNVQVLGQERLKGFEYVINPVFWNGIPILDDAWKYKKIEILAQSDDERNVIIYGREILLPHHAVPKRVLDYAWNVCKTLKKRNGAVHMEIFDDPEDPLGPAIVDFGNRFQGGINQHLVRLATGRNQVDLTLDVFANHSNPALFLQHLNKPYELLRSAQVMNFVSYKGGRMNSPQKVQQELARAGVDSVLWDHALFNFDENDPVPRTSNLGNSPGELPLLGHSHEYLDRQYQLIREAETRGVVVQPIE